MVPRLVTQMIGGMSKEIDNNELYKIIETSSETGRLAGDDKAGSLLPNHCEWVYFKPPCKLQRILRRLQPKAPGPIGAK